MGGRTLEVNLGRHGAEGPSRRVEAGCGGTAAAATRPPEDPEREGTMKTMKTMKAGRWVLLGFNLVLATAILAQPGQAASGRGGDDCMTECFQGWTECVLDHIWGCNYELNQCMQGCLFPVWGPPTDPYPF